MGVAGALLLGACGFVAGWSFEVRETAVFAWPVIAWVLWGPGAGRCAPWRGSAPGAGVAGPGPVAVRQRVRRPVVQVARVDRCGHLRLRRAGRSVYVGTRAAWYATIMPRSIWEQCRAARRCSACLVVGLLGGVSSGRSSPGSGHGGRRPRPAVVAGRPCWTRPPSVRLDIARYWLSFIVPLLLAAVCTLVIAVRRSRGPARAAVVVATVALPPPAWRPGLRSATTLPEARPQRRGRPRPSCASTWRDRGIPHGGSGPTGAPAGPPDLPARSLRGPTVEHGGRLLDNEAAARRHSEPASTPGPATTWCSTAPGIGPAGVPGGSEGEGGVRPFPAEGWQLLFTSSAGNLRLYQLGPDAAWPPQPEAGGTAGVDPDQGTDLTRRAGTERRSEPDSSADEDAPSAPSPRRPVGAQGVTRAQVVDGQCDRGLVAVLER